MNMIGPLIFLSAFVGLAVIVVLAIRNQKKDAARNEALFVSMFPDLQPYYHPKNVLAFVRARLAQEPVGGMRVPKPDGFDVDAAEVLFQDDKGKRREVWRLLNADGREISRFFFESDAKDGMVRFGQGKFRVARNQDRVRYWHPEREFKWVPPGAWKFVTRVFEEPVESSDSGLSFSNTGSSPAVAATAAAAVGIAAAGGAFDGAGASAAWSARGRDGEGASTGTSGTTSY